jgi:hypothetical protein
VPWPGKLSTTTKCNVYESKTSSNYRIEIEILDLNDNPPEFEVDLYNISIVENLPSGFSVLQVNAIDRDQVSQKAIAYTYRY